ncbi:MAG TPA: TolC family protein [Terriglobales bacterium]|jgi:cobalt-zinc-cadmium efflux system outer membrane protein
MRHLYSIFILLASFALFAGTAEAQAPSLITLDQAIDLALTHSHALKAAQTEIQQNQAQEITANLRPNPNLSWDGLFFPLDPSDFTVANLESTQEFDLGVNYLFERGGKRRKRLQAAKDATAVTRFQVADTERNLIFNVAQQFIDAQLANSNFDFAQQDFSSFQQTVTIAEAQYKAGAISEGDYLKITLQLLQFQTDVAAAEVAKVQALAGLRELLGYDAVAENFDVEGDLTYKPLSLNLDDLRLHALQSRPDLLEAQTGVKAAQSQIDLAKANGKIDLTAGVGYSHLSNQNTAGINFSLPLPLFDRNQGEIARTRYALTQAQEQEAAASDTVMTDIRNAYESVVTNQKVVQLYASGYLKQAQDSRDISEYAYKRGAASLLDYLDAERSYRSTQLAYRQALANYLVSIEQLKESVGTRTLP